MPTIDRPTTIAHTVSLHACATAPAAKSTSATRMTRLRPRRSARTEEKGETRRAKREVHEVMMDLSSAVRGREESEVPRETRVEEITPVSSGGFFLLVRILTD
jgi:hypothetical protein